MIYRMTQGRIRGAFLRLGLGGTLPLLVACVSTPPAGDASISQAARRVPGGAPRSLLSQEQAVRIERLVANLDKDPDLLHLDITPAVLELGSLGLEIIPYLQAPLLSPDEMTRLHAQRALERMLSRRLGFVAGQGWTSPEGPQKWQALWAQNGSYDWQAPKEVRNRAVTLWMQWFKAQSATTPPGLT